MALLRQWRRGLALAALLALHLAVAAAQSPAAAPAQPTPTPNGSNRQYGQWGFVLQTVMAALLLSLAW
uniref:Uncharacterized protein n=1 Tax=Oryza barthii TaxID=65489 RepID=A0A0D3EIT0_9ORYZ